MARKIEFDMEELVGRGVKLEDIVKQVTNVYNIQKKEALEQEKKRIGEINLNKCRRELILSLVNYIAALGIECDEIKEEDIKKVEKLIQEQEIELKPYIDFINSTDDNEVISKIFDIVANVNKERDEYDDFDWDMLLNAAKGNRGNFS